MSLTMAFEEELQKRVLGSLRLTAPRRDGIDIVLNSCELRSGTSFRFGSRESGCWRYGTIDSNATSVAHAVAASAAYPAILPAIDQVVEFTDRRGQKNNRLVLLTDGGIYDGLSPCAEISLEPLKDVRRRSWHRRRRGLRRSTRTTQLALSSLLRHHAGRRTDHERSTLLQARPEPPYPTEVQR
jgi:hypothetical protein